MAKKIGFKEICTAHNGLIGYETYKENQNFDIILMDCQMPEMDGLEATVKIREFEKSNGLSPVPIVAVTADAIKGVQEKCMEVGMNDYMTKPINEDQLIKSLQEFLCGNDNHNNEGLFAEFGDDVKVEEEEITNVEIDDIQKSDIDSIPSIDLTNLRLILGDDKETEKEIFQVFIRDGETSMQDLSEHINDEESDVWKKAAHKLKGSAANLGAEKLASICKDGEKNFNATLAEKEILYNKISQEFINVKEYLTQQA